jgi:hypothetical protein
MPLRTRPRIGGGVRVVTFALVLGALMTLVGSWSFVLVAPAAWEIRDMQSGVDLPAPMEVWPRPWTMPAVDEQFGTPGTHYWSLNGRGHRGVAAEQEVWAFGWPRPAMAYAVERDVGFGRPPWSFRHGVGGWPLRSNATFLTLGGGQQRLPLVPVWPGFAMNTAVNALAAIVGWLLLYGSIGWWRRRRVSCEECGYSRAGLPSGVVCPECGAGTAPRA